ncbi:endoplasmic reticulum retention receptor [Acrodontium crateriforme]|uniref:Endoplasmic reticulum retention receptor n=1 Tax=Acrodontium crateriforme TaxID=150365 RepID=A0AAQ3M576_9PEZI|nr:endoplasmic reticulum retention receptor [Acrodontium crateriforme]
MAKLNPIQVTADMSHVASKCILIWAIHRNKSAEGVSLLTQLLYILVFFNRYIDIFWSKFDYLYFFKIFYIASSAYIVFIMMRVFARTREKEYAWKLAIWSLAGCTIGAPLMALMFLGRSGLVLHQMLWAFSIELEAFCILPQLLLLRQTTVPTVIDSYYLVTLGAYRFIYIINWIYKAVVHDTTRYDGLSMLFGIIQTAFYIDFAWVYYTRQRVKLRGGGVVDSDDLSKSFLVRRFINGRRAANDDGDDDNVDEHTAALSRQEDGVLHAPQSRRAQRWGARGISVSADDTLLEHDTRKNGDAQMMDPADFEDDEDVDDSLPATSSSIHGDSKRTLRADEPPEAGAESSAGEWQENSGK